MTHDMHRRRLLDNTWEDSSIIQGVNLQYYSGRLLDKTGGFPINTNNTQCHNIILGYNARIIKFYDIVFWIKPTAPPLYYIP